MIGSFQNSPQESLQERINEVMLFEKETNAKIISILKIVEPILPQITKQDSPVATSIVCLHSLFQALRDFERKILNLNKPSLDSFADEIIKRQLKKEFQNLINNTPSVSELTKFLSHKNNASLASAIKADGNIAYWFHLPFIYAAKWERFWEYVLSIIPAEDPTRGVYQQCRNEFKAVDHDGIYKRLAEQYKKQLEMLKNYGKSSNLDFNQSMRLYACIKGNVISGSLQKIDYIPSFLFLFEDKIALMKIPTKNVMAQSTLNIWLVPSTMFARSQKIIDVLGTDFSFAFQPETSVEYENLWKTWDVLMSEKPRDYGIFQPIILNPEDPLPILDWVEINE
ncbi:hypothetical protein TRFO_04094 [Tritrichomonas foetus]|uniref:Uncharacterized protein n=1 Tax=Tritrichomonas foetus TaxID=1144522 RepID=A0A1J4KIS6_9EUKA|nr:hypothetical protein TRFO_04094 [Tritrichomonas foetus]|eukprot:OHT11131.1 hypothetical protein TRFO_04094 [Tritrichomonas foetus]